MHMNNIGEYNLIPSSTLLIFIKGGSIIYFYVHLHSLVSTVVSGNIWKNVVFLFCNDIMFTRHNKLKHLSSLIVIFSRATYRIPSIQEWRIMKFLSNWLSSLSSSPLDIYNNRITLFRPLIRYSWTRVFWNVYLSDENISNNYADDNHTSDNINKNIMLVIIEEKSWNSNDIQSRKKKYLKWKSIKLLKLNILL